MEQEIYRLTSDSNKISKYLSKYSDEVKERLAKAMMELQNFPHEGDIKIVKNKKLWGKQLHRKRVGAFRIFFIIDHHEKHVHISGIKHRKEAY